jgi:methylated-DNA-[protein]-cysteine S-methyltransferase
MENKTEPSIYWTLFTHDDWKLHIAATSKGLCYVGSQAQPFDELAQWAGRRFKGSPFIQDDGELLQPYIVELSEYLDGARQSFTVPFDFHGTAFQLAVWSALCNIPYGQTRTYTDIANQLARPAAVRAVGTAIGANPILIMVPCHRVIGKNGALTGYRGGMPMKTELLQFESNYTFIQVVPENNR